MEIFDSEGPVLDIQVDDSSYRYRAIRGDNSLTLYFSTAEHVEIPLGAYCDFQGERYTLESPENLTMRHRRLFEYTVLMEGAQSHLSRYKFRNTVDRRLKFSLTATPREHLQMLVDNLNARESGWTVGDCVVSEAKVISYNHTYCDAALSLMADTFDTEYEIDGKKISLKKIEYNKSNPLVLSYGKGNGFRPGVGRTNPDNARQVEILYVQGGSRNIDAGKYGNAELLLPKDKTICFDGSRFEDEDGFVESLARTYVTDTDGYSIRRADKTLQTKTDDSLDCSEIYPSRDEVIRKVIVADQDKNWYDVVTDAPESLDYSSYGIGGETPTIVFQSGELAGREFDLETDDDGNIVTEKFYENGNFIGWKFQIVPQETDGITMPGGSFIPAVNDVFRVFGIQLPDAYIEDDATKSGASWDMFRQGVRYLYEHEDRKFTFTGELDGIWAKKDWLNIGGKIRLGGFVQFSDSSFQKEPVLIRITGIKDYINNPYSPEIEISNSPVGGSVSSSLNKIESNEVVAEEMYNGSVNFTKRRFRDAQESISMLQDAMLAGFTDGISPITVQTMMMLVGDQSLQFRFVNSTVNPQPVAHNVTYDAEERVLRIDAGIIQHMTLGIDSVSTSNGHSPSEYMFWTLPSFESPVLTDPSKKYYVYAKVSRTAGTGVFYMSETAKAMDSEEGYYYLLMGLLNSEYEESRSYVSMYGFTEILPGQVTTDVLRDANANLVIDLSRALITAKNGARIIGSIEIGPDSSGLENLEEWGDLVAHLDELEDAADSAQAAADAAQDTADAAKERIEGWVADGVISPLEKRGLKDELVRIKADYEDVQSGYAKYGLGTPVNYNAAYAEYYNDLVAMTAASPENIPVPSGFETTQTEYYDEWVSALDAIAAAAKAVADAAQDAAEDAQDAADAAQDAADGAQAAADAAAERLDEWADDGYISPTEKPALKDEIARIDADKDQVTDGYTKYKLGTPSAFNSAYDTYRSQLVSLSAATPESIEIPSTFRSNQTAYYDQRTAALNTIATAAKQVADAAQNTADAALERATEAKNYIDNTLPEEIAQMNAKIDGVVENFFFPYTPSRSNEPAATWISEGKEAIHIGDTFTNTQGYVDDATTPDAGKSWRWVASGSSYIWTPIADSDAVKALQEAAKAQDTADQKRRVFVNTPYPPYDVGDMWVQGPSGEIMRCISARASGSYVASDWDKASKYTDDTLAQSAISKAEAAQTAANTANQAAQAAQNTANQAVQDAEEANATLDDIMSDSVITPPEKTALKQQQSDIQSEYDQIIADAGKYGVSTSAYTSAYNSANTALNKYTAASPETITVGSDYANIAAYYDARQTILNAIATAAKKVADDAQTAAKAAQDDAEKAAANASKAIQDAAGALSAANAAQTAVNDLDYYIDNAFHDGVIDEAESMTIESYLNLINESWADLNASYQTVYANPFLTGSAKTNLASAYSTLSSRKTSLVNAVNTAVSNPSAYYINAVTTAFNNYNSAVASFKTALETATKSIEDAIRQTAEDAADAATDLDGRLSDIEYLETVFPNATAVGGAYISKMAVVIDENEVVQAGLNGTTIGQDSTHGKALIFAGSDGVGDSNLKNAATRIYQDGTIVTNKLIAQQGSQLGNFTFRDDGLWFSSSDTFGSYEYEMQMSSGRFMYTNTGLNGYETSVDISTYPSAIQGSDHDLMTVSSQKTGSLNARNTALLLSAAGANNGLHSHNGVYQFDGNFAIRCTDGMFAGMRPMTRRIPGLGGTTLYNNENYLTADDCIILVNTTSSIGIYLPTDAQNGQYYEIWTLQSAATRNIYGNGHMIRRPGISTAAMHTFGSGNTQVLCIVFSSEMNQWMMSVREIG